MKKVIIISGHGNYATGLQSSLELLAGPCEDVYYIDFTVDDTDITLKEKMNNAIKEKDYSEALFICDILGGTPFKVSAGIANNNDNMEVVAGCNIGSILEAILQKDSISISELAESTVYSSKKTTVKLEKIVAKNTNSNIELEDGI